MGMRVWFGGEFDYGHERAALIDLLGEAVPRWGEEQTPYALFVDFWVGAAQIDLMAITQHALVIIDLKDVGLPGGYLRDSPNGDWLYQTSDGHCHVVNENRMNPFQQVDGYRKIMMHWLRGQADAIFDARTAHLLDPQIVDAWIVATPSIDQERTREALAPILEQSRWFRVIGLDTLCNNLYRNIHKGFTITEREIERMAALHGLKEKRSYAGFLWPGTLREPKPPLFRDPPRHRFKVGRKAEFEEARSALAAGASVLSVVGVKGVGKSHLAVALADELAKVRPVRWVDCGTTRSCEVSLETLLLALAHEMPRAGDRQFVADRDQQPLERIRKALDWCDETNLAIVVDDYDGLGPDNGIDEFIRQLDQRCHRAQAVVISNRRPDYLSDPGCPLDGAYTLALGGLSRDDTLLYLKTRSAKDRLHLDLRKADSQLIWERTGGLPEMLEHLAQVSANQAPDRILREAGSASWEEMAHKLCEKVMKSVSPEAQQLAAAATVVRRGLDSALVLALAEPDAGQVLLNELVNACILTCADDRWFVLPGGLRQYLCDRLDGTPELRTLAHSRTAAHLLGTTSGRAPDISQVEEALWHASVAGEWEMVLQHAPRVVEPLSHRGEYGRALAQAAAAEKAGEHLGRDRDVAHWRIEQGAILRHMGKAGESERLCREGLEWGESHDDRGLKARAFHVLGSLALARADHDAARTYCEAALDLDRTLENRAHEAASLARLAGLEMKLERTVEAADLYRQSLALAESEREQPSELAGRHFDLGVVQKYAGKLEDALAHLEQARGYAAVEARPSQMAVIFGQLAEVKGRLHKHQEALDALDQALALRGALADPRKAQITLGIRVDIYIDMGDVKRAAAALKQLEEEAAGVDDPISQAFLKKRRGLVWLLLGRESEGLALVDEACTVFRAEGRDHWVADCMVTVEQMLDRLDRAANPGPV